MKFNFSENCGILFQVKVVLINYDRPKFWVMFFLRSLPSSVCLYLFPCQEENWGYASSSRCLRTGSGRKILGNILLLIVIEDDKSLSVLKKESFANFTGFYTENGEKAPSSPLLCAANYLATCLWLKKPHWEKYIKENINPNLHKKYFALRFSQEVLELL